MKSELNPWRLIHFHKLKVVAEKYASRIPGNFFMQRYENTRNRFIQWMEILHIVPIDIYKSNHCFYPENHFELPNWNFVLRLCKKILELYFTHEEISTSNELSQFLFHRFENVLKCSLHDNRTFK